MSAGGGVRRGTRRTARFGQEGGRVPGPGLKLGRGLRPVLHAFLLLMLVLAPVPLAAQQGDWGGTLDSASNLRADAERSDPELQQLLRLGLWAEVFGELRGGSTVRATGEVSYRFEYDQDPDEDVLQLLNLDLLRLVASIPTLLGPGSTVEVTFGRFVFEEPTGVIWGHTGDGLRLENRAPGWGLVAAGAYTGLLLNPVSAIRMTETDSADESDTDEFFGPRRAIGLLAAQLPELVGRQSATTFAIVQRDLRDADEDEETLDTWYLGALVDGPIEPVRGLYYELFGVGGFGRYRLEGDGETDISSGLYGLRLQYFREAYRSSRAFLEWLHASGGDRLDPFVAINAPGTGFAFSPDLTNLMLASGGYSFRPFTGSAREPITTFQAGGAVRAFFRSAVDGAVFDAAGLNLESDRRYVGSEMELRLVSRPRSDFGLAFTNAVFIPNSDLFEDSDPRYRGRFEISLGF